MTHSRHPLLALVLSLLLLGVQLEGQRHALQHVGEALDHTRQHSLLSPSDACVECTLLAAGSSAIAADLGDATVARPAQEAAFVAPVSITPAFFAPYRSRAPPALL